MPTDENRWKEMMIESGQMQDNNGYWHYNPKAIEDIHKWMLEKEWRAQIKQEGLAM